MLHMKQTEILKLILQERYPDHTAQERALMQEEEEGLYDIFVKFLKIPEREARQKVILRAKAHDFTGEFLAKAKEEQ